MSPALYSEVFLTGPLQSTGALLKGIDPNAELGISDTLRHLKAGSLDRLRDPDANPPGIILGARLVEDTGMILNSIVNVVSPQGELTPMGVRPAIRKFKVVGIFETGFFEIDDKWAFTSIHAEQRFLHIDDQVNQIELNVDNLDNAPQIAKEIEKVVGPRYTTTTWLERNKQLLGALNMERVVTIITIGLIELVAALNIFITLVMMVMEKYRDIAVLMSMGARQSQIRRIFMLQGVLIGIVGSAIGLTVGYTACYFADEIQVAAARPDGVRAELRSVQPAADRRAVDCGGGDCGELPGDDLSIAECDEDHAGGSAAVRVEQGRAKSASRFFGKVASDASKHAAKRQATRRDVSLKKRPGFGAARQGQGPSRRFRSTELLSDCRPTTRDPERRALCGARHRSMDTATPP